MVFHKLFSVKIKAGRLALSCLMSFVFYVLFLVALRMISFLAMVHSPTQNTLIILIRMALVLGLLIYILLGGIGYYVCYRNKGSVIECFISGIIFPVLLCIYQSVYFVFYMTIPLEGFFSILEGRLYVKIMVIICSIAIGLGLSLLGSLIMHLIVSRKTP